MSRTLRPVLLVVLSTLLVVVGGAVPASAGGGGGCQMTELTDEATNEVKVNENCFSPTVVRVDEGARVTWFSGEFEAPHTVTGVAGGFGSDDLPAEGRVDFTFSKAGVFPYVCLLHPGMVGVVVVGGGSASDGGDDAEAAAPPVAPDEPAAAPTAAPASDLAVPWRTVFAVAVTLVLCLAVALLLRKRTPSASL